MILIVEMDGLNPVRVICRIGEEGVNKWIL